jgi:quercetin dioxygenase-like cupin family protein
MRRGRGSRARYCADIDSRVTMDSWNLNELDVQPHQPQVLDSESEGRAILINLPKGEQLQEHQVHERAWLLVIDGNVELNTPDGKWAAGGVGLLAIFDPKERHEVLAVDDSRLLLVLSPWPGDGHPSQRAADQTSAD